MSKNMKSFMSRRYFLATVVSSLLSIFTVAVVAYGATMTISSTGLGSGTSTPGMAISAKGGGLFEGPVGADFFYSTSSDTSWLLGGNFGLGTTTPGAKLATRGAGLFEGYVSADYFTSTSTNTSWIIGGNFGLGTTTPGTKLAVSGPALIDDFVWTGWMMGTSTAHASGFGTTSPGSDFAVAGSALFDGKVTGDYFNATSTTATSSIRWGLTAATSTFQVDGATGRVVIGATTTLPQSGGMLKTGGNSEIGLTITGTGNAANATGTVYIAGVGASGGELILKSSDGNNCVSIMAKTQNSDPDTASQLAADLLSFRVTACPK